MEGLPVIREGNDFAFGINRHGQHEIDGENRVA
jgi:hypothetical protein